MQWKLFAAAGLSVLWLLPWSTPAAERPNILFVLTDDQAPWAVGAAGYKQIQTPHMDRLFGQGAYLPNAFVTTPVCSPSRASLMASRYGSELGITDWIHPAKEPQLGLDPAVVTWPEVLHEHGFATGLIGKWHLGTQDRFHPTKTGFDYFMGFREGGNRPKDPLLEKAGRRQVCKGLLPDILTDDAIAFLERNQGQPFLLCLHFRAPHAPWLPVADEDWAPYAELDPALPNPDYPKLDVKRLKRMTREYLASVSSVDRNLGRLVAALDRLALADNTIVIFTSDHGYNMGHNGIWHKGNGHWILTEMPPATENVPRGQRPNMYDNSLRSPTAIRWPGVVQPGTVVDETISFLDFYPTILAMAGLPLPPGETVRGRNMVPLLQGRKIAWDNRIFGQYSTHHQSRTDMRMVRTPEWKLIRDLLNPERDELFDLGRDPAETTNRLHDAAPEVRRVVAELDALLVEKMREINDPVLLDR